MANGRGDPKRRRGDTGRDAGAFVALPWSVLDSLAYQRLSPPAKALLMEVARQFHSDDNGRMLLSSKYLAPRGWTSNDVITRAKQELLDAGLIFQTVQGHRPNKASWYAVTWRRLDKIPGFDTGAALLFEQGAYRRIGQPAATGANAPSIKAETGKATPADGFSRGSPSDGVEAAAKTGRIAPSGGAGEGVSAPSAGAMPAPLAPSAGVRGAPIRPMRARGAALALGGAH